VNVFNAIDAALGVRQAPERPPIPTMSPFPVQQFAPAKPTVPHVPFDVICHRAAEGIDVVSSSERDQLQAFHAQWQMHFNNENQVYGRDKALAEHDRRAAEQWRRIYELGEDVAAMTVQSREQVIAEFDSKRDLSRRARLNVEKLAAPLVSTVRKKFLKAAHRKLAELDAEGRTEADYFSCEYLPSPRAVRLKTLIARLTSSEAENSIHPPAHALPFLKL